MLLVGKLDVAKNPGCRIAHRYAEERLHTPQQAVIGLLFCFTILVFLCFSFPFLEESIEQISVEAKRDSPEQKAVLACFRYQ